METQQNETMPIEKTNENSFVAKISERVQVALAEAEVEERLFVLRQRQIMPYAKSDLVPLQYRNRPENCLIARELADRIGASILAVMQNVAIIHGRPAFSSKFAISAFNVCGKYSSIWYESDGKGDDYGYTAFAIERSTGRTIKGVKVDWKMVKAEGWLEKNGSKWKTMPELMFKYRAASFLISTTAPEILNGMRTVEELEDTFGNRVEKAKKIDAEVSDVDDEPQAEKSQSSILADAIARRKDDGESESTTEKTKREIENERAIAIEKARALKEAKQAKQRQSEPEPEPEPEPEIF